MRACGNGNKTNMLQYNHTIVGSGCPPIAQIWCLLASLPAPIDRGGGGGVGGDVLQLLPPPPPNGRKKDASPVARCCKTTTELNMRSLLMVGARAHASIPATATAAAAVATAAAAAAATSTVVATASAVATTVAATATVAVAAAAAAAVAATAAAATSAAIAAAATTTTVAAAAAAATAVVTAAAAAVAPWGCTKTGRSRAKRNREGQFLKKQRKNKHGGTRGFVRFAHKQERVVQHSSAYGGKRAFAYGHRHSWGARNGRKGRSKAESAEARTEAGHEPAIRPGTEQTRTRQSKIPQPTDARHVCGLHS